MKKILTLLCLLAANSLWGQVLLSESDTALLEKFKLSRLFNSSATNIDGVGTAQMLSLRGITRLGKYWYFSIYDASLNSCFWVKLKDGDRELALIKAEFFDDENKELEITTSTYTHILALKERDPLTGQVPNILSGNTRGGNQSRGQQMGQMLSGMNNEQKAAMAMQLAASMMGGRGNMQMQMQGGNMQGMQMQSGNMQGNNMQGGNNSSSGNKSSNKSSSNKSSSKSSSKKK